MKTIANIAFRNLSRQKKRTFLLGGAIAFGVMIVTLINGFAGAFSANVSENFSHLLAGHVFISGAEKSGDNDVSVIRDDAALTAAVAESGIPVEYLTRRSEFSGTLIFEGMKIRTSVAGVELEKESYLQDRLMLKAGSWKAAADPRAIILSEKIAERLNVDVGDRMLVQMQTVTGQNNVGEFVLAGISYDTGIFGQMLSYAGMAYVNELLGLAPGEYQTMGIMLDSIKTTEGAANAIYAKLAASVSVFARGERDESGSMTPFQALIRQQNNEEWTGVKYRMFTINEILSQVEQIVTALDTAAGVILVVLFIIIMVGIANTFSMVMFERIREIGTMRAIGVQRSGVRSMFLFEALYLAVGGAVAGIAVALLVMAGLSLIDFGMNSPAFLILKNGHLSFFLPPLRALVNILIIALLTLLAVSRPAGAAARLEPAVALRTQK
ncbi:MAG: FtsX-like permease family protein [Spirochaetales bacterium]|nr:MAG: FtsX-like permease family protein [Spirochaetales bacterium]